MTAKPVRDMHGHAVHCITVAPGELTCVLCGETTNVPFCFRCDDRTNGSKTATPGTLVPTISYLRAEEYEEL